MQRTAKHVVFHFRQPAMRWTKSEMADWSVEIQNIGLDAFQDVNTKAPKHGDVWLGNLARGSGGHGLAQWSKDGTAGFGNPKSFNKFRFVKED